MKRLLTLSLVLAVILMACTLTACSLFGGSDTADTCSGGHTWEDYEDLSEATCTMSGSVFKKCSVCGIKKEFTTPPIGHVLKDKNVYVAPTCTEEGYKGTAICTRSGCDYVDGLEIIPTVDHKYGKWTSVGDGTHKKTCTYDDSHVIIEECSGGTATCSNKATCKVCGGEYGEKDSSVHTYVDGVCSGCGEADPNYSEGPEDPEDPEDPEEPEVITTIAGALAGSEGASVSLSGNVSEIYIAWNTQYSNMSYYLTDGTDTILVFRASGDQVGLGDEVSVVGTVTDYNGTNQVAQGGTTTLVNAHVCSTFTEADCYNAAVCTVCGEVNGEALGHADEDNDGFCDRCDTDMNAPAPIEVSISFADVANRIELTTSQQVWEQNGITVTNDKATSTSDIADYSNPARFYKNSTLTVVYAGMTKIVFNCNNASYATALQSSITDGDYTVSVNVNAVTVEFNVAVDSFVVTLGNQVRMDSIDVTATESGSQEPSDPEEPISLAGTYTATDDWNNSFAVVVTADTITFTPPMNNEVVVTYTYENGIVTLYADGSEITNPFAMSLTITDGALVGMMYNGNTYTITVGGAGEEPEDTEVLPGTFVVVDNMGGGALSGTYGYTIDEYNAVIVTKDGQYCSDFIFSIDMGGYWMVQIGSPSTNYLVNASYENVTVLAGELSVMTPGGAAYVFTFPASEGGEEEPEEGGNGTEENPYVVDDMPASITFESDTINKVYYIFTASQTGAITFTWPNADSWYGITELDANGDNTANTTSGYETTSFSFDVTEGTKYRVELGTWMIAGEVTITVTYGEAGGEEEPEEPIALNVPVVTVDENGLATWEAVENASGYIYIINDGTEQTATELSVQLENGDSIKVKAVGDETNYTDSEYSEVVTYTATTEPEVITTIAGALAGSEGASVSLSGTVSGIYEAWNTQFNNMAYYLTDGTDTILVFRAGGDQVGIGDEVSVVGTVTDYNGTNQIAQGGTTTLVNAHVCSTFTEADCYNAAVCTVCGEANGEALGHTDEEDNNGVCDRCGTDMESAANEVTVTAVYTGTTTTNMTGDNDAALIGLDATIFNVVSTKLGNNHVGLNKDGTIRLYAGTTGCDMTISVVDGYKIVSVKVTLAASNGGTIVVTDGTNTITATDNIYAIDGSTTVLTTSGTTQVRIASIEIVYTTASGSQEPTDPEQPEVCEHTGGTATCTTKAVCDLCGEEYGEVNAEAHNWNAGEMTTPATCSATGTMTYTCTHNAEHTKTEDIAINAEAHNWNAGEVTTPATCSATGTMTYTCTHNAEHTYTEEIAINAENHTGELEWTKTATTHAQGYTCCGAVVVAEANHVWEDGVCSVEGCGYVCQHTYEDGACTICGKEEPTVEYVTFYYNNESTNWSNVNAYVWENITQTQYTGVWPGSAMNDEGNGWYSIQLDASLTFDRIIFNDGANQTADLTVDRNNTYYNNGVWENHIHTYSSACDTTCNYEGCEVTREADGHVGGTATCTSKALCDLCGEEYGEFDLNNHEWNEGEETTPATCSATGTMTYTCTRNDQHTKTEEIAIDTEAHAWDECKITEEATCTTVGEITYTCTHNAEHTYTEEIAKLAHEMTHYEAVAATCTTVGNVEYWACSVCGYNYDAEQDGNVIEDVTIAIDVDAHTWDEGIVTKPATCTEEGEKTLTCINNNSHTTTEAIEKTAHNYVDGTCTNCPAISKNDVVATFEFGANGSASHSDGNTTAITQYTETSGDYTITFSNLANVYGGARDAKGNSALKLGSSSKAGTFTFTVPSDVTKVIINVAQRNAKATSVTVNSVTYTISTASDNGEYTAIEIDTTSVKTISFASGASGDKRCMINNIKFEKAVVCEHENATVKETIAPTCTEQGYTVYTCTCGEYNWDYVDATGHTMTYVEAVASTCKTEGNVAHWTCSVCEVNHDAEVDGNVIDNVTVAINPENHENLVVLEAVEATCLATGLTEGQKCEACDTVTVEQNVIEKTDCVDENGDEVCDVCGNSTTCEHSWSAWEEDNDDTHSRICELCTKVETVDHTYGDWTVNTENSDYHDHTCSVCNHTETATHNTADASYVKDPVENWHNVICNDCGGVADYEVHTTPTYEVNATDNTKHDVKCDKCGVIGTEDHTVGYKNNDGSTHDTYCTVCNYDIATEVAHADNGTGSCDCGKSLAVSLDPVTYTIANYPAGTQYAVNEVHELDDNTTIYTTQAHFTSELRLYSSSAHDGYAIIESKLAVNSISINAGNNVDTIIVYATNEPGDNSDYKDWTVAGEISITSTSYSNYTLALGGSYKYIALDVKGTNQVRIKSFTLTF